MINQKEVNYVSKGMIKYGSSFVKALGQALIHADHINTQKVKDTWTELWHQYYIMGERLSEEE